MGLTDQEMALRWVRENIYNFQGDPGRITLVGHEAGAACVGIHLISPITSKAYIFCYIFLNSLIFVLNSHKYTTQRSFEYSTLLYNTCRVCHRSENLLVFVQICDYFG